ncbi:hypothetical protein [Nocardia miyunensis]|uniref:hypothetical protein n=1 Tax=Nocardia miyunensis TaxID=282684 RepID=UPI000AA9A03E|nr:hypothetical protein [Nocardia miyunensis]
MARRFAVNSGARRRALVLGAIPLALAVGCSSGGQVGNSPNAAPASGPAASSRPAIPDRSGTATPYRADTLDDLRNPIASSSPQPGVVSLGETDGPIAGSIQPGVTATPVPLPARIGPVAPRYVVPRNFRPVPGTEAAPAIELGNLHAPTPVAPVAPIAPPPRTLRLGAFSTPVPDNVPDTVLGPTNIAAADTEAAIATGLNSVGINAGRSDKIAGLTIAGAAGGAVLGATAAGVPAAVVGAIPGAVIGAGVGAVAGGLVGGTAGVGNVAGATAGAAIGAGVGAAAGAAAGAAVVGIPAALVGGVAGGIVGGAVGSAFGAAV